MPEFGVTPSGFVKPTYEQLLQQIEADQLAEISPTLDVSERSLLGKLNRIKARHAARAWDALESIYNGSDPDNAAGAMLAAISKLTGTERRRASQSEVELTCDLDEGTELLAGEHFAHVEDDSGSRWTPKADYIAAADGPQPVAFVAEHAGPVAADVDAITVIATPVNGWNAITASGAVKLGRNADDDATLRERREQQLHRAGSGTLPALRSDLLELDNVEAVKMLENTKSTGSNGLPAHSFEAVILGTATDNEIAQVLWDNKPSGIRPHGSSSGAATDENGDEQPVRFSRTAEVPIYLEFDVVPRDGYTDAASFAAAVAAALNGQHDVGDDVELYDIVLATAGLGARVTATRLGLAESPAGTDDIAIAIRQIARFDASRIMVNEP